MNQDHLKCPFFLNHAKSRVVCRWCGDTGYMTEEKADEFLRRTLALLRLGEYEYE